MFIKGVINPICTENPQEVSISHLLEFCHATDHVSHVRLSYWLADFKRYAGEPSLIKLEYIAS